MLEKFNEDYSIYKIGQKYQSFSNKILLPLDEFLQKITSELIDLMTENCEVELCVNFVLGSKINPNNECNVLIKVKSADLDGVFDQPIKKYKKTSSLC